MARAKVAVSISGRGSNLQALLDACADPAYPAEIVLVLSNRPGVGGLERAQSAGVPTSVVPHGAFRTRAEFEGEVSRRLRAADADYVCLAGFMRLLTDAFVDAWRDRLLNIHPSLLPAFKGLHTHERVLQSGARFHGCTVHFVRPAMDEGPILAQAVVPVRPDDTPATLGARVLEMEHLIYPTALRAVVERRVQLVDERAVIEGAVVPEAGLCSPTERGAREGASPR